MKSVSFEQPSASNLAFFDTHNSIINTGLFFTGSYWVYSEYKPNFDPQKGLYCDKVTYHLAFWTITIHYTLLLMVLLFCTLAGLYMCLLQSLAEKNVKSSQEEVV